jgi:lysophospholipase L1-like esterase
MLSLQPNDRVLFQGDSITDAFRIKDPNEPHDCYLLGAGYAGRIAGDLRLEHPRLNLRFLNRGIAGNTLKQLHERWLLDAICLEPDVLSLLVGVNDASPNANQSPEEYETLYRRLLERTLEARPTTRLILLEPFGMVHGSLDQPWRDRLRPRQETVAKLAEEFGAAFVPLQSAFDEAATQTAKHAIAPTLWTLDGIHPSAAGHALIARQWKAAVRIPA